MNILNKASKFGFLQAAKKNVKQKKIKVKYKGTGKNFINLKLRIYYVREVSGFPMNQVVKL